MVFSSSFRPVLTAATLAAVLVPAAAAQYNAGDDVFYHFMPICWRDSDNDIYRFGDFGGMTDSLDYLEYLGVTAVWMNPVFPSPAYHGYQHGRADELNSWFGTEAEFIGFVQAAHARGIKVYLDYVVYGISCYSPWFDDAYGNPSSPYDDWLAFENSANTTWRGSQFTTWNGDSVCFIHWNLNNPNPVNLVTTWGQYWLDPNSDGDFSDGIDGYRLDHVWEEYPSGPNGWGYNIDDFWVPWKQALQAVNPDVFTFAEQADWGSHGVDLLPAFDATMTKPFEFAARDALANELASPLYSEMAATMAVLPPGKTFVGIIGDHDVTRLASEIGSSFAKGRVAAAVLLTQPFPPIIYHGDEIGMLGYKTGCSGDTTDIGMREPFKWNAVAGPPMTDYWVLNGCALANAFSYDNDGRSVEEQLGVSGSLLEEYRLLIATRRAHAALRRGSYNAVVNSSDAVWTFVRHRASEETLLVAINLAGSPQTPLLDLSTAEIPGGSTTVQDVIGGSYYTDLTDANKSAYELPLPAYGYLILDVDLIPGEAPGTPIDGVIVPDDFDPPDLVATQNNATGLGDNVSELNQMYVYPESDGLRIGLTGNLDNDATGLCVFFDTVPGGQNTLRIEGFSPPPGTPLELTGLVFDPNFAPDQFLYINAWSANLYVDQIELTDSGDTPKVYRGSSIVDSGSGILSGGSNTYGMQVALDDSNTLGVTDTSAAGADTATTGIELFVPYAYVELPDDPGGSLLLTVFLVESDGNVSNQWLPGLGGGYANLGLAPDMTMIPGDQHVQVLLDRRGDMNCDNRVDFGDINPFVAALVAPGQYASNYPDCDITHADVDGDGFVDFGDINPFVDMLLGS